MCYKRDDHGRTILAEFFRTIPQEMVDLGQIGGHGCPSDALMEQADLDLFHPSSIVASELIAEFGSYRSFLLSNRKGKRKIKNRVLILDIPCEGLVKILRPVTVYSETPITGVGEAHYHVFELFTGSTVQRGFFYVYGQVAGNRHSVYHEI